MKLQLSLKDNDLSVIDELKELHSIDSREEIVVRYVKSALQQIEHNDIFASEHEKCNGACFGSEPQFEIDIEIDDFNNLKKIYKHYNFDQYDSEAEEISKVIRCIFNFIADKPGQIKI